MRGETIKFAGVHQARLCNIYKNTVWSYWRKTK